MNMDRTPSKIFIALLFSLALCGCEEKQNRQEAGEDRPGSFRTAEPRRSKKVRNDEFGTRQEVPQPDRIAEAALKFAEEDPAKGLEWAQSIKDQAERTAALRELAWSCANSQLEVAVAAVDQMPPGEDRNKLTAHLAASWATKDSAAALDWAKGRADEDERDEALGGWTVAMGESSPVVAATLAADEIRPGLAQNRAVVAVLQRWAQKDFDAAKDWVDKFPEGHLKDDALRELEASKKE
jgi:hypothetical protein